MIIDIDEVCNKIKSQGYYVCENYISNIISYNLLFRHNPVQMCIP